MSYALPDYLTRNARFDDCPPGHRFGLYFDGWEADWRKPSNKTPAFKTVANALPEHSRQALRALCARLERRGLRFLGLHHSQFHRGFRRLGRGFRRRAHFAPGFLGSRHGCPHLTDSGQD